MSSIPSFILVYETNRQLGIDPFTLRRWSKKIVLVECKECGDIREIRFDVAMSSETGGMCASCSKDYVTGRLGKSDQERKTLDRKRINRYYRDRRKSDEEYRLKSIIRGRMNHVVHGKQVYKEGNIRHLGYTSQELVAHITNLLASYDFKCPICETELYEYEIDHKIPLSIAKTHDEIVELFALSNLDVLCGTCNRSKRDKVAVIQEAEVIAARPETSPDSDRMSLTSDLDPAQLRAAASQTQSATIRVGGE